MRVASFAEIENDFTERAHRLVWCDMATVGPDGAIIVLGRTARIYRHPY